MKISFFRNIREGVLKFQPTHLIGVSAFVLFIIAMIDLHDDVELLALYMADSFDLLLTICSHGRAKTKGQYRSLKIINSG